MQAIIYSDGGSRGNPGPGGSAALVFKDGQLIDFKGSYFANCTNNQAEYQAFLLGAKMAAKKQLENVEFRSDSELLVKQLLGEYKIKDLTIQNLAKQVKLELAKLKSWQIKHIPREQNSLADKLVNLILDLKI